MKAPAIIGNIVFVLLVAAAGWFVFKPTDPAAKDPDLAQMKTPRGALMVYLRHADGFKSQRSNFYDIEKCIVPEDWKWFQKNHEALFAGRDSHSLAGGLAPTDAVVAGRMVVMAELLGAGPRGTGSLIIKEEVSGNHAEFIVRKKEVLGTGRNDDYYYNCRVHLVKVDDFWRVKDFAGGRAVIEGRGAEAITAIPQQQGRLDEKRAAEGLPLDGSAPPPESANGDLAPPQQAHAAAVPAQAAFAPPPLSPPPRQDSTTGGAAAAPSGTDSAIRFEAPSLAGAPEPSPGSGGEPAMGESPSPSGGADSLADADRLLTQAGEYWKQRRFGDALRIAESARAIRLRHLGPSDPKVQEVDRMIERAKEKLAGR